jgi:hypothetical protein
LKGLKNVFIFSYLRVASLVASEYLRWTSTSTSGPDARARKSAV